MGGGDGGASWKLKKAARKIFVLQTCASFCNRQPHILHSSSMSRDSRNYSSSSSLENQKGKVSREKNSISPEIAEQGNSSAILFSNKNLCTICLDPLTGGRAIFTAQCTHTFHFACIATNISHGSLTCPICRARWTQLPHTPKTHCPVHNTTAQDPTPRTPEHPTSHFRPRTSFSPHNQAQIEPDTTAHRPRLSFSLLTHPTDRACYLKVKLNRPPPIDLVVIVAFTTEPPLLSLVKWAMAAVASSLGPADRLAVVTPACITALRRMTPCGKRATEKVVRRLSWAGLTGLADDGLERGVKVLAGRLCGNPRPCILHLTWGPPGGPREWFVQGDSVEVRRFSFGFGSSSESIVGEFEGFLAGMVGGRVENVQLRMGDRAMVVRIGEMRGGEERNIPVRLDERGRMRVEYSYRESGRIKAGDVGVEEDKGDGVVVGRRLSSYGDLCYGGEDDELFRGRRWDGHLHGMW